MKRFPDWPSRLAEYLSSTRDKAFEWGSHDCVTFAAGAVEAITGHKATNLTWHTQVGAGKLLAKLGGLSAAVDSVLPRRDNHLTAQRGDVVMVTHGEQSWLAVVDYAGWVAPSQAGLVRGPIDTASIAWKVG